MSNNASETIRALSVRSAQSADSTSIFIESGVNQFFQLFHCFLGIWSLATNTQLRSLPGSQHHQAHYTFAVYFLSFLRYPDFRAMPAGNAHEHLRRAGMQPKPIHDW